MFGWLHMLHDSKKTDAWSVFGWLHRISSTYLLQEVVTLQPTSSVQGFYITSNANWTSISNLEKRLPQTELK